jgi:DNA-binding CsgD family transcriptional regulator
LQVAVQRLHMATVHLLEPSAGILTPREKQCLECSAKGLTVKRTAQQLQLSDQTVTFYLGRIRMKLGVSNTTEAVALAIRRGLISV